MSEAISRAPSSIVRATRARAAGVCAAIRRSALCHDSLRHALSCGRSSRGGCRRAWSRSVDRQHQQAEDHRLENQQARVDPVGGEREDLQDVFQLLNDEKGRDWNAALRVDPAYAHNFEAIPGGIEALWGHVAGQADLDDGLRARAFPATRSNGSPSNASGATSCPPSASS